MTLIQKLAEKDTQIALRDAVTYTDRQNLDMYKYIDGRINEIKATLSEQAVQNQANKDSFVLVQQQMAADKAELQKEICCEKKGNPTLSTLEYLAANLKVDPVAILLGVYDPEGGEISVLLLNTIRGVSELTLEDQQQFVMQFIREMIRLWDAK